MGATTTFLNKKEFAIVFKENIHLGATVYPPVISIGRGETNPNHALSDSYTQLNSAE